MDGQTLIARRERGVCVACGLMPVHGDGFDKPLLCEHCDRRLENSRRASAGPAPGEPPELPPAPGD